MEVEQQIQSTKENINNVTNALLHQNGINMDVDQYENLSIESRESVNKVAEFVQNLGVDVSFDSTLNNAINGYNINGQIVLNPNSDTMQSAILGHEVTHNLENSKKYAKLVELIKSTTDYQGILNDVTRTYKGVTENLESEAIAKYIEQNIANDSFIESVIKYDSSFANRVFNNIKSMFGSNEKVKIENAWMRAFENAKKSGVVGTYANFIGDENGIIQLGEYSVKYSKQTIVDFAKEVDDIVKGKITDTTNAIMVDSNSPKWMVNAGYNDLLILITKKHIESAMGIGQSGNQHSVSQNVVSSIPSLIKDPIAVFNYKGNDLFAILKATDNNGNIVVAAIEPNGSGMHANLKIATNFLLSTYGKEKIVRFFNKTIGNNIVYSENGKNKKEVLREILKLQGLKDYSAAPGLQLSNRGITSSNGIVANNNGNVNFSLADSDEDTAKQVLDEVANEKGYKKAYHGTNADFNVIDISNTKNGKNLGNGFYLTNNEDFAREYGDVKEFYYKMDNPFVVSNELTNADEVLDKYLPNKWQNRELGYNYIKGKLNSSYGWQDMLTMVAQDNGYGYDFAKYLQDKGYD